MGDAPDGAQDAASAAEMRARCDLAACYRLLQYMNLNEGAPRAGLDANGFVKEGDSHSLSTY